MTRRVTEAVSCSSAAKSRDLSAVNCLVLQKLASAVTRLTDDEYQMMVSCAWSSLLLNTTSYVYIKDGKLLC